MLGGSTNEGMEMLTSMTVGGWSKVIFIKTMEIWRGKGGPPHYG